MPFYRGICKFENFGMFEVDGGLSGACAALHRNVFAGKVDHPIESKHLMDTLFLWREEWPKKHIFYCPILSMCFVYNVPLGAYKE